MSIRSCLHSLVCQPPPSRSHGSSFLPLRRGPRCGVPLAADNLRLFENTSLAWRDGLPYCELCRVCHMVRWPGDWCSRSGPGSSPCTNRRPQMWHNGSVSLVFGDFRITSIVERRPELQLRQRSRGHSPASLPASAPGGSNRLAALPPTSCLRPCRRPGQSESLATLPWGASGHWAHLACSPGSRYFPRAAGALHEHWACPHGQISP